MDEPIEIRQYKPADVEKIVELLKLSFPEWARKNDPIAYWRWKYEDTPLGNNVIVAAVGDEIFGVTHNIALRVKVGGSTVLSYHGDDVATHPEYRGRGVYHRLLDELFRVRAEKRIYFNYYVATNPVVVKASHMLGGEFPHQISHMSSVKDVKAHLKAKSIRNVDFMRPAFLLPKSLNILEKTLSSGTTPMDDFTIYGVKKFDERIDHFWAKVRDGYDFIMEKNREYLNWRYCDARGGNCFVKLAVRGEVVLGYAVLEVKSVDDYSEGYVLDLLALPGRYNVAETLLGDVCTCTDDMNINAVHYHVVRENPYQSISSKHGFFEPIGASKIYLGSSFDDAIVKDYEVLATSSPARVHFTRGDFY